MDESFAKANEICSDTTSVNLVDGNSTICYKSDRFYLHTGYDEPIVSNSYPSNKDGGCLSTAKVSSTSSCTCGANKPPPLFDRQKLVNSLNLEAAIFGTFNVDLNWMIESFPNLLGPSSSIPTLILHGQKGLFKQTIFDEGDGVVGSDTDDDDISELQDSQGLYDRKKYAKRYKSTSSVPIPDFRLASFSPVNTKYACSETDLRDELSFDEGASMKTQEDMHPLEIRSPLSISTQNTDQISTPDGSSTSKVMAKKRQRTSVGGKFVHLTRVLSNWTPLVDDSSRQVSRESPDEEVQIETKKESKFGVHHPKFMILFEKSGDIVVVVSTANLTSPKTTEGSWVQRFHRRKRQLDENAVSGLKKNRNPSPPSNDFGMVLTDFLQKLSESAMTGHMKVDDFLNKYLKFGLSKLDELYRFDKASIHLIPVVPGEFPVEKSTKGRKKEGKYRFRYGRQRVEHILATEAAVGRQAVLLHSSKNDRLVVQPTSFGGNWRRVEMAEVCRSYLNLDINDQEGDDYSALGRLDIVWPSREFMGAINKETRQRQIRGPSPRSVATLHDEEYEISKTSSSGATAPVPTSSFVFMSSQTFNSCEESCISRLAMFKTSDPPQRPRVLAPHFKSVSRCVRGKAERSRLRDVHGKSKEYFSWFLLTSACLSLGAQGKSTTIQCSSTDRKVVSYANFELGVLFTSHLNSKHHGQQRLYCFKPRRCSCNTMAYSSGRTLVHLPVPFSLRPKSYVKGDIEESTDMIETPFIHEVTPETRCVGNMLFTPWGKSLAKKLRGKKKLKI